MLSRILILLLSLSCSASFGQYNFIGFKESPCGIIPDLPYSVNYYQYSGHGYCYELYYKGILIKKRCEYFGSPGIYDMIFLNDSTLYLIEQYGSVFFSFYKTENNGLDWNAMGGTSGEFKSFFVINQYNAVSVAYNNYKLRITYLNEYGGYSFYYDSLTTDFTDTVFVRGTPLCTDLHELNYRVANNGDTINYKMVLDYYPLDVNSAVSDKANIYPNPAEKDLFVINENLIREIKIFDIYGKILLNLKPNQSNVKVGIENLPKGIYILCIESDYGISEKKFIKN